MSEILRLITEFVRAVEKQGEGEPGRDGLLQQIRPWQEEFRGAIRETAPCFVPQFKDAIRETGPCLVAPYEEIPRESNESAVRVKSLPDPLFLEGEESSSDVGLDDGEEIFIDDVLETAEWCVPPVISDSILTANFPSRAVTRELPNNYPFIVQREYITNRVYAWHEPAHILFNSIVEKLKEMTLCIVDTHFEHYAIGGLKQRVR